MTRNRILALALLFGVTLAGFASNALALTGACTNVTNQATLSYTVGGVAQSDIDSDSDGNPANGAQSTDFTVDTKVDLTISTFNSPVTATGINQVLIYRITNTGNDTQRYQLQLYAGNGETVGGATDNFDMANVRVVVDTTPDGTVNVAANGTVTVEGPDETIISGNAATDGSDLGLTANVAGDVGAAPANVIEVYVISDVPAGRATGDDALYTLKARTYQTAANFAGPGAANLGGETTNVSSNASCAATSNTVLADGAATDTPVGAAGDAANNGDYFATGVYTVSAPTISVTKTQTILWDPVNGAAPAAQAIPGAYVQYVITINNSGTASAILGTISDPLVAELALDPDLIDGTAVPPAAAGAPENAANDAFKVVVTGSTRAANGTDQYFDNTSVDGVDLVAGAVVATFSTILPAEAGPPAYAAGELKAGESVSLTFNAIIQ